MFQPDFQASWLLRQCYPTQIRYSEKGFLWQLLTCIDFSFGYQIFFPSTASVSLMFISSIMRKRPSSARIERARALCTDHPGITTARTISSVTEDNFFLLVTVQKCIRGLSWKNPPLPPWNDLWTVITNIIYTRVISSMHRQQLRFALSISLSFTLTQWLS